MAASLTISPQGEFEIATWIDQDGALFVQIDLPDRRSGDRAQLVFALPAFVTFADWVKDIADRLIDEAQQR